MYPVDRIGNLERRN